MKKKLISIVVPCYNEEEAIPLYYDAMQKQMEKMNYVDFEIIFVNDGSTDNSKQIIYKWKDKFLKKNYSLIYVSQENRGLGGALIISFFVETIISKD